MSANPPRPLVVVWRVTEACDLNCWFCEYNRALPRSRRAAAGADVLAFGRVLADYTQASGRPVLISWLGGEPLVWPSLVETGQFLHHELGLALGLTTNGWQLRQPALLAHLAETYAEVTFSVDGPAPAHDYGRGAAGVFEQVRLAVGELRARHVTNGHGPRLRANTILMRSNLRGLEELGDMLAAWGIEEMTFNPLGGQPPGPNYAAERLLPADVAWLAQALPGLRQRLRARGLRLLGGDRYLGRVRAGAAGVPAPVADCHPGAEFWFVDERGRAAPCAFTPDGYGVPIAELRTAADMARLPARFAAARQAAVMPVCRDCPSPQVFGKFEAVEVL